MGESEQKRHFRNLTHWQMGQEVTVRVLALVEDLPRTRGVHLIVTQLVRSAGSIPANIAEGYGRYSKAAYRNHLSIARGSLFETQSWLDLLARCGFLSSEAVKDLDDQCEELARILTARMKALEAGNGFVREVGPSYEVDFDEA